MGYITIKQRTHNAVKRAYIPLGSFKYLHSDTSMNGSALEDDNHHDY